MELEGFSGGGIHFHAGGNEGGTAILEVEKVIHIENKEQLKAMEEKLGKEKL